MSKGIYWRYIGHPEAPYGGFRNIGIQADGTLHNPNGYPEEIVRAAIAEAEERRRQRRSDAAKKAAVTRRARQEQKTYELAQKLLEGIDVFGPANWCEICRKALGDPQSIARGVGSDCWQAVLKFADDIKAQKAS